MKRWLWLGLGLAAPLSSPLGCGGDGCLRNTDCASDYVCRAGRCELENPPESASGGESGEETPETANGGESGGSETNGGRGGSAGSAGSAGTPSVGGSQQGGDAGRGPATGGGEGGASGEAGHSASQAGAGGDPLSLGGAP